MVMIYDEKKKKFFSFFFPSFLLSLSFSLLFFSFFTVVRIYLAKELESGESKEKIKEKERRNKKKKKIFQITLSKIKQTRASIQC